MPYKDPEKRKEAVRKAKEKAKAEEVKQEGNDLLENDEMPVTMDTVEQIACMTDPEQQAKAEAAVDAKLMRYRKSRVWAAILYPESLPPGWNETIIHIGLKSALSPLHNMDLLPDGVTKKKDHFHFLMVWDGPTTYQTAKSISRGLLKGTIPIPIVSPRGYYRYFTHLDNPDKAQYDPKQITHYNGFDPGDFLELTKSEVLAEKKALVMLCLENGFMDYADLVEYVMFNGTDVQFDVVSGNTMFFASYLKSRWQIAERTANRQER